MLATRYLSYARQHEAWGQYEQAEHCLRQAIDAVEAEADCTSCGGSGMVPFDEIRATHVSPAEWIGAVCPCVTQQIEELTRGRKVVCVPGLFDDDGGPF